jgi:hypothetical protein
MIYVVVGVIALALVSVLNTLVVAAMGRRLRDHIHEETPVLTRVGSGAVFLPQGSHAPEVSAITYTGETLRIQDLRGSVSLMGFFAAACGGCRAQVPGFLSLGKTLRGTSGHVVAVIDGEGPEGGDLVEALAGGGAVVVVEPDQGALSSAFTVRAFPTFYALDSAGRVQSSAVVASRIDVGRLELAAEVPSLAPVA